jgi:adenosine deaminase
MSATADPAAAYLRRVPKVELHVHLEGAMRPERLFRILRRHGARSEIRRPEDLAFLYRHANFAEFLEHFKFAVLSIRDVQDVHDVALDLFRDLVLQHVVYAEVIFSASIFTQAGMPLGELLAAVEEAETTALGEAETTALAEAEPTALGPAGERARADAPAGLRYNLVVDVVRNFGADAAEQLVGDLVRTGHPRVVGIHLGGDEVGFPARWFERAFAAAAEAGLGRAAHAGEADGAASVRAALEVLDVQRIGHGIRCLEDPELVRELVRRRTTLEVCPTSNVCTGLVRDFRHHPLPALLEAGLAVCLGADDPSYFATDLTRELRLAHSELGLALPTLDRCVDTAMEAAFLPAGERRTRLEDLRARREAVRTTLGMPPFSS